VDTFVENRLFVTELADDGSAVVTVAHEALLWHWPRVQDWVAQNRENLRIRARVAAAAQLWEAENRPADLLLPTGKPLVEAESLLEHGIALHKDEAGFIQASIARARRIQRIKAGVVATVAALAVLAGITAFLANHQRKRAQVEAETAKETTTFMVRLFEVSDPSEARGNTITAREIMDQGAERIQKELADQPAHPGDPDGDDGCRLYEPGASTTRQSRCCRARSRSAGPCMARSISMSRVRSIASERS
jgi:hypothetical protein